MARIAGIDLPNSKRVEYGLTYIFGIGVSTSNKIHRHRSEHPLQGSYRGAGRTYP